MINFHERFLQEIQENYKVPTSLDEMGHLLVARIQDILDQYCSNGPKIVGLAWDLKYSNQVSNSHSRPVYGVENWSGKEDAPTGYPGFHGRVWYRQDKPGVRHKQQVGSFTGSDAFGTKCLFYTGTGGYGSYYGPWDGINHLIYKYKIGRIKPNRLVPDFVNNDYLQIFSWDCRFYLDDWKSISDNAVRPMKTLATIQKQKFQMFHQFKWEDPDTAAKDKEIINMLTVDV